VPGQQGQQRSAATTLLEELKAKIADGHTRHLPPEAGQRCALPSKRCGSYCRKAPLL
jgi:hypothetical protein